MNENLKKGLLIGAAVIAVGLAAWQIGKSVSSEQPHVEAEYKVAPGHKSEKELALEAQAQAGSGSGSGGGAGGSMKSAAPDPNAEAAKEAALAGN